MSGDRYHLFKGTRIPPALMLSAGSFAFAFHPANLHERFFYRKAPMATDKKSKFVQERKEVLVNESHFAILDEKLDENVYYNSQLSRLLSPSSVEHTGFWFAAAVG